MTHHQNAHGDTVRELLMRWAGRTPGGISSTLLDAMVEDICGLVEDVQQAMLRGLVHDRLNLMTDKAERGRWKRAMQSRFKTTDLNRLPLEDLIFILSRLSAPSTTNPPVKPDPPVKPNPPLIEVQAETERPAAARGA